jgi:hypothetical protein
MALKLISVETIKSANQLALATHWDALAAGRRFPALAELKPDPAMHDPRQLVVWNVEGEGRLQKYRALYQGENLMEVFNTIWAGKTMEQVVPMSLRRLTLDAARECATSGCLVYMIFSTIDSADRRIDCHRLLLPFGRDGSKVEQIIGSLQLNVAQAPTKILRHFELQADVLVAGRIKSGFTRAALEATTPGKAAGNDKRKAARRDVVMRTGKISFARQIMTCTVRNISATGAAIEGTHIAGLPDQFSLVMEMESAARDCKVVWRKPKQIGVEFR